MTNALYAIYGKPLYCPWFPRLRNIRCEYPDSELPKLDAAHLNLTALYFLCQNKGISYIGIAGTKAQGGLFRRLRQHWRTPSKPMDFCYAFPIPQPLLSTWEAEAISHFRPESNSKGRDYTKPCNDEISGLAKYLTEKKYFSLFTELPTYRIDFAHDHEE
jgi:hypothetical protein